MRKSFLAAVLAFALLATSTSAEWVNWNIRLPVDRVVANVEAWIKEKPADPQAEYVLGRVHAMAYAYGPELSLWQPQGPGAAPGADPFAGQLPAFVPYATIRVQRRENDRAVTPADARHLEESIRHYKRAVELDPKNALYHMGLAWMCEEASKVAAILPNGFGDLASANSTEAEKASYEAAIKKLGDGDARVREDATKLLSAALPKSYAQLAAIKSEDPETTARVALVLKTYWDLHALNHYRIAYSLALEGDIKDPGGKLEADARISAESGDRILAILKFQPQAAKPNEGQEVADNVRRVRSGARAITPIVFAMPGTPATRVGDLVDTSKRVPFDLAGDGLPRQWPWLNDGTAILVWDPLATGHIADGKQLFGSRTWWIFFRDGFEALSVLDDNRDGQLAGGEMQGIAVWIDKNGDAVSQKGEVISLEAAGIIAIDTRATKDKEGILISEQGITFKNGTTVKSFDWVTRPVATEESLAPPNPKSKTENHKSD